MLKPNMMRNIRVVPYRAGGERVSIMFSTDDAQYHVWINASTMTLCEPILYKNSPAEIRRGDSRYFETRHLNATSATNKPIVDALLAAVVKDDLVAKAFAAHSAIATEQRAIFDQRANVLTYWKAMMNGETATRPDMDDSTFLAVSQNLVAEFFN